MFAVGCLFQASQHVNHGATDHELCLQDFMCTPDNRYEMNNAETQFEKLEWL